MFKPCECRRPSSCPHLCTIRFRNTRGKRAEESGFPTQDAAIERLTELYTARKAIPRSIAEQQETGILKDAHRRGIQVSTRCSMSARRSTARARP